MNSTLDKAERAIFVILLAGLLGLPVFRTLSMWHWAFFATATFTLLAAWASIQALRRAALPSVLRCHRTALSLGVGALGYLLIKSLPIWPEAVVTFLSPEIVKTYQASGINGWNNNGLYALSIDAALALREFVKTATYFALMFLVLVLVNNPARARALTYTLALSAAILALWGLIDFSIIHRAQGRATGGYGNSNMFAGFLQLGIGLAVGLLYSQRQQREYNDWPSRLVGVAKLLLSRRVFFFVLLLLLLSALFASGSRGGTVAIVASLIISSTILLRYATKGKSTWSFVRVLILLCIVSTIWLGADVVLERFGEAQFSQDYRLSYFRSGTQMIEDYPLFGMGGGSWQFAYSQYRGPEVPPQWLPLHAHNDHLQMVTEHGLIGYLMFGGFIVATLPAMVGTLRHRRDTFIRGITFGSLISTLSLLFHAFTDNNFQITTTMAYFFAILGLALAVAKMPSSDRALPASGASP